ncbi:hypothetical protein C2G38_963441 [Gigaspora rosea]|uniref:Uncharacterized protein n=1 Tax=Gigaspora rosea TaxID=44941 RepID=A0A397VUE8_9GLOM|nr:hypothetical protein C2G38_963441 [Gigaspora rosea]
MLYNYTGYTTSFIPCIFRTILGILPVFITCIFCTRPGIKKNFFLIFQVLSMLYIAMFTLNGIYYFLL